ncbi:MAG: hypothetical protein WC156_06750 [Pedobacter sp.]
MKTASMAFETAKQFCTRNPSLRILSLGVALCIWSVTAIPRETRYDLVLPVELRNIPPGYALASQPAGNIRFTLSGPSILIDGTRRSNPVLILNLRGINSGKTIFSHLETNLNLPEDIRVTRISPASIEINLIRKQTQSSEGGPQ